jgi:hypothetical protein
LFFWAVSFASPIFTSAPSAASWLIPRSFAYRATAFSTFAAASGVPTSNSTIIVFLSGLRTWLLAKPSFDFVGEFHRH